MGPILLALALLMQRGGRCAQYLTVKCKEAAQQFCKEHIVADDPRSQEEQQRDDDEEARQRRRD